MWDDFRGPNNTTWVAIALKAGTLVCVTDGSYNKYRALDISGIGRIIYDKVTRRQIQGSFVERFPDTRHQQLQRGTTGHASNPPVAAGNQTVIQNHRLRSPSLLQQQRRTVYIR